MWTRILEYLKSVQSPLNPAEYILQTAERWAVADRLASRGVIMMGDFNKSLHQLQDWTVTTDLDALGDELLSSKTGSTFASFNGTSTTKPSLIDHIFLQAHKDFQLTSISGTMHPQLSNLTDHNVIWTGLQWPETPPLLRKYTCSTRITNYPDLPTNKEMILEFQHNLDSFVESEQILHPDIDQLTPTLCRLAAMYVSLLRSKLA